MWIRWIRIRNTATVHEFFLIFQVKFLPYTIIAFPSSKCVRLLIMSRYKAFKIKINFEKEINISKLIILVRILLNIFDLTRSGSTYNSAFNSAKKQCCGTGTGTVGTVTF
jgi:hypothetical protein